MSLNYILFCIAAVLAVAGGIVTITSKSPVRSAMALVVQFFMFAAIYLTLNAQFVAIVQVLVYAGAIMVLVVFVIMLLNLGDEEKHKEKSYLKMIVAFLLGGILLVTLISFLISRSPQITILPGTSINQGTVEAIGKELYSGYLLPFEAIGLLLLVAIVGAVILAKRKID